MTVKRMLTGGGGGERAWRAAAVETEQRGESGNTCTPELSRFIYLSSPIDISMIGERVV